MTLWRGVLGVALLAGLAVLVWAWNAAAPTGEAGSPLPRDGGLAAEGTEPPIDALPLPEPVIVAEEPVQAPPPPRPTVAAPETTGALPPAPEPVIVMEAPRSAAPGQDRVLESGVTVRDVPIFFATNRTLSGRVDPDDPTAQFTDDNGKVIYGRAVVSLPPHHRMGELESQGWLSSILFDPNPEKHVVVQSMTPQDEAVILAAVARGLAEYDDAILIYVHGYNTSLDKAVRRTGQLTYDLAWHGPSFLFSWPSRGDAGAYFVDSTMAARSEDALIEVLTDLAALEPGRVVIISHSMGTRVLSGALSAMVQADPAATSAFTTVILAAPDIDEDIFHRRLAPRFRQMRDSHVTLYASSEDTALRASMAANGFPRIGDTSNGVPVIEGIDVIDASDTVSDFFGHTYFGDNATILSDIFAMVHDDLPVNERATITEMPGPPQPFWKIVVD